MGVEGGGRRGVWIKETERRGRSLDGGGGAEGRGEQNKEVEKGKRIRMGREAGPKRKEGQRENGRRRR